MHVVILCYRRSNLVKDVVRNLSSSRVISSIDFIIDAENSPEHKTQRDLMIKDATKIANSLEGVYCRVKVFSDSTPFTEHTLRTHTWVMRTHRKYIVLEEDTRISPEGIEFLKTNFGNPEYAKVMSAYSGYEHNQFEIVKALSPQFWGAAFNDFAFVDFQRVYRDRKIKYSLVSNTIDTVFPRRTLLEKDFNFRAKRYWEWYFKKGVESGKHPDVIHLYAQWSNGNFIDIPTQSFVVDMSYLSGFAMNPRPPQDQESHTINKVYGKELVFCLHCERSRARIEVDTNILKNVKKKILDWG